MQFAKYVKQQLRDAIKLTIERKEDFVVNPQKDFIRNRKLDLNNLIELILSMHGNSLNKEIFDFTFERKNNTLTASAFVQQRAKLKPDAFKHIFSIFTSKFKHSKKIKDYQILAVDGCKIQIPYNPNDIRTYIFNGEGKQGSNRLHLNAVYDVLNRIYVNVDVEEGTKQTEATSLVKIIKENSLEKSIIICDRGYEMYNLLETCQERNQKYLIRVKDPKSGGVLSGIDFDSPDFQDELINLSVTKTKLDFSKQVTGYYKRIGAKTKLDNIKSYRDIYTYTFRVVKIKLFEDNYEYLLTNLDYEEFTTEELKNLYNLRWGIESSFRELKYALGMLSFHSKKMENTMQEVYAKLIMHNFCEIITRHVIVKTATSNKHTYQVNYTMSIQICLKFFLCNRILLDIEKLIKQYVLPVRPGRKFKRDKHRRDPKFFIYRIS